MDFVRLVLVSGLSVLLGAALASGDVLKALLLACSWMIALVGIVLGVYWFAGRQDRS